MMIVKETIVLIKSAETLKVAISLKFKMDKAVKVIIHVNQGFANNNYVMGICKMGKLAWIMMIVLI
jgi:hypothetical protein